MPTVRARAPAPPEVVTRWLLGARPPVRGVLRRACRGGEACEDCEQCRERHALERSTARDGGSLLVPPIVHQVLGESGRPLDEDIRAAMEPRFRRDFSSVRVHTGALAADSARAIDALAYTAGRHVVLGVGMYPPKTREASLVLAHELTHVAQGSEPCDRPVERIGPADDAMERHAESVSRSILAGDARVPRAGPSNGAPGIAHPYRSRTAFNFGVFDIPALVESEFTDPKTQPWIERIALTFTGTKADSAGDTIPTGSLEASYHANPAALPNINMPITGGSHKIGFTDSGTGFRVTRIEGVGYNDVPLPPAEGEGPRRKYARSRASSMSFAIFFHGGQAIHIGDLNTGSHACAHGGTDLTAWRQMQQLNYHSVRGRTKVDVSYTSPALQQACCARMQFLGVTRKGGAPNPCRREDPATCP